MIKQIIIFLCVVGLLATSVIAFNFFGSVELLKYNKEMVEVTDRVSVGKSIIDGYENQDYIPRSASINQANQDRLKIETAREDFKSKLGEN